MVLHCKKCAQPLFGVEWLWKSTSYFNGVMEVIAECDCWFCSHTMFRTVEKYESKIGR
jgi:C4-type Zn-finger protein